MNEIILDSHIKTNRHMYPLYTSPGRWGMEHRNQYFGCGKFNSKNFL